MVLRNMTDTPFTNREIELMLASIDLKLTQVLDHVKETNGRVHKLEILTVRLEKDMEERDSMLEKLIFQKEAEMKDSLTARRRVVDDLIASKEAYLKQWVLKALIVVTLCGSFIWIKESRDAVISIIKMIV